MADSTGAEGGTPFSFNSNPPAENSYAGPHSNIAQPVDVTSISNDKPDDGDYDDAYPGGSNGVPLLPLA